MQPGHEDLNAEAVRIVAFGVPCALIIGQRKESTDLKTSLNDVLREFALQV